MAFRAFNSALAKGLPVLFVNIGWSIYYNGTETITGNHKYIKEHPRAKVGESRAFVAANGRYFRCGIGIGRVPSGPLHIVFVARDQYDQTLKTVGIYAAADVSIKELNWGVARTRFAERIPVERRQPVVHWPNGQGMRRWAKRNGQPGMEHKALLSLFRRITKGLSNGSRLPETPVGAADDEDGHEGELKKLIVRHRKRESKFRRKKIIDAMKNNNGRLICEVPRCGFDFHARYGEVGAGFAEVHHKKPLSEAPRKGQAVRLADLAIVCANCHRMIHHSGQCRPLDGLIPE
jgi:hypothetical protein